MKQYFLIGLLVSICIIVGITYSILEKMAEHSLKHENVRQYIHQMVFANGGRSRAFTWEQLPIPIYLDLHNADIRSEIENAMRAIEHNIGVPLFVESSDYRQAQIFLVTSSSGQERLPEFLTRFLHEVLGQTWLELSKSKAPFMFDPNVYPKPPLNPCFTQEFFSDPSTQYDGGNGRPTHMQIFVGGVEKIENDILQECLVEELLNAAFFLRDADLAHGKHSIFNQSAYAKRARVPTPFDLCLISTLLHGSFDATELDKMANSIYLKLTSRKCPVWRG